MTPMPIIRVDNTIAWQGGHVRNLTLRERLLLWYAKRLGALVNLPKVPR